MPIDYIMKSAIRYIACKSYCSQWKHVESLEPCGYIWVYALAGKQQEEVIKLVLNIVTPVQLDHTNHF